MQQLEESIIVFTLKNTNTGYVGLTRNRNTYLYNSGRGFSRDRAAGAGILSSGQLS